MKALFRYKDIEVLSDDSQLVIRNSKLCRKFDLSAAAPKTVSLTDSAGKEFASPEKDRTDLHSLECMLQGQPTAYIGGLSIFLQNMFRLPIKILNV